MTTYHTKCTMETTHTLNNEHNRVYTLAYCSYS